MASLTSDDPNELAIESAPGSGVATFSVDATSFSELEIWERFLPFTAVTPFPPFMLGGNLSAVGATGVTRSVGLAGIHQVRLLGPSFGGATGPLLGKLDFPCLRRAARTNFLTRCASMPQIDLTTGGTFISMAFATSVQTRARVQIGVNPPALDGGGFPFFAPGDVVASGLTDGPKLLHKVSLIDELTAGGISGHPALSTGQKLFFVILCWDAAGSWDLVWNQTGVAPATKPELITTKNRMVEVKLHRLRCLDDSDDFTEGEATFEFRVRDSDGASQPTIKTFSWDPMKTDDQIIVKNIEVTVNPPNAADTVDVKIKGVEDDTGSFPPDSNDTAETDSGEGGLTFPVGEGKEEVNNALLTLYSRRTTFSERLSFIAEVVYSVKYI